MTPRNVSAPARRRSSPSRAETSSNMYTSKVGSSAPSRRSNRLTACETVGWETRAAAAAAVKLPPQCPNCGEALRLRRAGTGTHVLRLHRFPELLVLQAVQVIST